MEQPVDGQNHESSLVCARGVTVHLTLGEFTPAHPGIPTFRYLVMNNNCYYSQDKSIEKGAWRKEEQLLKDVFANSGVPDGCMLIRAPFLIYI